MRNTENNSKAVNIDVRSTNDIASLEKIIKGGPITIVLIYADWCGHCTRFKENVWSKLLKTGHRAGLASIHHDQLENTSLKDAKIKGYPSVLVVGKDGKPAVFKGEDEPTNAMPKTDLETLKKIADADAETILKESEDPTASIMTPPDAREDDVRRHQAGGAGAAFGNLFKLLKKTAQGIFGVTKKRRSPKKTRKAGHTRR